MRADRPALAPLLLGHFGGHNAGDEAILDSTCRLLDGLGIEAARVVARRADYRPELRGACRVEVVAAEPVAIARAIKRSSVVVLCGGTHFYDDIPRRRRLRHYRYLARYLLVLGYARLRDRPVLAIGQGIGPVVHPTGRALTRVLFRLVSAGTVRDDASLARARGLGARASWTRTADTVFERPAAPSRRPRSRRSLALVPLYGACGAGTDVGDLGVLWDALVAGVTDAWSGLGVDWIDVLAVRGGDRESDSTLAAELAERCRAVAPIRISGFSGKVDELMDELGAAAIVVCGRYHGLVLSLLAGAVPIVLPTHQKLIDTAELVGLPDALIVREATPDAIAKALVAATELDAHELAPRLDELRRALDRDWALLASAALRSGAGRAS